MMESGVRAAAASAIKAATSAGPAGGNGTFLLVRLNQSKESIRLAERSQQMFHVSETQARVKFCSMG
jgi:hypothetical protein